jgi:hypothetical protein
MRLEGWEQALAATTRAALSRPHVWGKHDCALFAADCAHAVTGIDCAEGLRGTYHDEASAEAVLAGMGVDGLANLPGRWFPETPVSGAQRGDIVLIESASLFLAVVDGKTAVAPWAWGLIHVPMRLATRAWRVG